MEYLNKYTKERPNAYYINTDNPAMKLLSKSVNRPEFAQGSKDEDGNLVYKNCHGCGMSHTTTENYCQICSVALTMSILQNVNRQ